ncbi:MAG TPA: hypothetical protein VNQ99_07570 [Xanthobacteraceae bacterium]|nr:hypothetical protein [Xanthobacteraceae bacterium]
MRGSRKIWVGIGAFVIAGAAGAATPAAEARVSTDRVRAGREVEADRSPAIAGSFLVAQHADHAVQDGEAGEQGGEQGVATLPPDIAFAVRLGLIRGHLMAGDELVRRNDWTSALPHVLHPSEEIYDDLKEQLADFKVAPFEKELDAYAALVKAKKGGADYTKALAAVMAALDKAEASLKTTHGADWPSFILESAIEMMKVAGDEYNAAIENGRIVNPVEYQDAWGFIHIADRMIGSVAADLKKKDDKSFTQVQIMLADLKKAFPTVMPPDSIIKDPATIFSDVARIELAAGSLK